MTIIEALNEIKAAGITRLVGMAGISDIEEYISIAEEHHRNAVELSANGYDAWQYTLDHEDDHRLIVTADGHYIIATIYGGNYGNFEMATYSNYDTKDEMHAAFDEIKISEQAESIADEMETERPGELPRVAFVAIATAELKAAYAAIDKEVKEAFSATWGSGGKKHGTE